MTTIENNWWLIEAGEYVLGTLGGSERELFEKVLEKDLAARAHVRFWEENFFSLEKLVHRTESSCVAVPDIPECIWDNILLGIRPQNPATILEDDVQQRRLNEGAAFAVSLEPVGGTTEPAPTGEVISIGKYIRISENEE